MNEFLKELRAKNTERCVLFGMGTIKDCSLEFKTLELLGEAGEVANTVKKIFRGDTEIHDKGVMTPILEALRRELADVIICTDLLAARYDIDLEQAVIDKFNKTSKDRGYSVFLDKKEGLKRVYLAIPYSNMEESSFVQATLATQIIVNQEINCFSPITHSHPLAKLGTIGTWDFWQKIDFQYIDSSDEVWVLVPQEGYEKIESSTGVQAELLYAKETGKIIRFIELKDNKIVEYGRVTA